MGLEQNLEAARTVMKIIRDKLEKGSNTRKDELKHPEYQFVSRPPTRRESEELTERFPKDSQGHVIPLYAMTSSAMALDKHRFAYCGEQADTTFLYLKLMGVYPLDTCIIRETGHQFVVIGRKKGSNPTDPSTWGDEAVICDTWAEKAYPASQFKEMQKAEHDVPYASFFNPMLPGHYLQGTAVCVYREEKVVGVYLTPPTEHVVVPVQTSTFRTVNFNYGPNQVLFSDIVTACVVVVLRYKNIATMAHFFPNNAYDVETARTNLKKALLSFVGAGGKLNEELHVTLYGGGQYAHEPYHLGPLSIMEDVCTKATDLSKKSQFKINHEARLVYGKGHICVFENINGTQVTKNEKVLQNTYAARVITPPDPTLPLKYMANINALLPKEYQEHSNAWSTHISDTGADRNYNGMPLICMEESLIKTWDEIIKTIPSKDGIGEKANDNKYVV